MRLHYIITTLLSLMFIACSSDVAPYGEVTAEGSQMTVEPGTLSFDANRTGTLQLRVPAGLEWEARTNLSWLVLSQRSGTGPADISITISEDNPSVNSRQGTITLTSMRYQRSATVRIEQHGTYLRTNTTEIDYLTAGGSSMLSIEANAAWQVKSKPSWAAVSITAGTPGTATMDVSTEANQNGEERSDWLTLETDNGAVSCNIKLTQAPLVLKADATLTLPPEGGVRSFDVGSNATWTVNSNADWCSVAANNTTGNGTVSVTVSPNRREANRTATITVKSGNLTRSITLKQEGVSLTVGRENYSLGPQPVNEMLTVGCNTSWSAVSDSPGWCSITPADGQGDGSVRLSIAEHRGADQRKATITVKAGDIVRTVTVSQSAPALSLKPDKEMTFDHTSTSSTLTVSSNTSWTVRSNATWCKLSSNSGSGNGSVNVTVEANPEVTPRTATLTVEAQDGARTATVSISQQGKPIELGASPLALTFAATGESKSISVTCNTKWTATAAADWLKLSAVEGTLNGTVSVTVEANTSRSPRSTVVTLTAGSDKRQTVTINQEAATLPNVATPVLTAGTTGRYEATFSFSCTSAFPITACGLCYSKANTTPTTNDQTVEATPGNGTMRMKLSGLESGTTYYVRAYAVSSIGLAYSPQVATVTTLGSKPGGDDNPTPNPK